MTAVHDGATDYQQIQETSDFQELRRRFRAFAFPTAVAFLAWYLLYVVLSGWAHSFMGTKVLGNLNIALVLGLLQFVSTFLIAWLYSRHAGAKLDPLAAKLRADAAGTPDTTGTTPAAEAVADTQEDAR
ncbi:DUF485 domain-containing protein [Actinomadura scrupuli]|uniref:DUF485 domain-containing protein n=1 Tax=Actinomadura scrupuli TaxID=559629 RepID=UPI003D985196